MIILWGEWMTNNLEKKNKLNRLLDRFESEILKFDSLPIVQDEKTQKDVDEQYERLMTIRNKIMDLVCD